MTRSLVIDGMEFAVTPMTAYDSLTTLAALVSLVTKGSDSIELSAEGLKKASPLDLMKMFDLSFDSVEPIIKTALSRATLVVDGKPGYAILLKDPIWNGKVLTLLKLVQNILMEEYAPFLQMAGLPPSTPRED